VLLEEAKRRTRVGDCPGFDPNSDKEEVVSMIMAYSTTFLNNRESRGLVDGVHVEIGR